MVAGAVQPPTSPDTSARRGGKHWGFASSTSDSSPSGGCPWARPAAGSVFQASQRPAATRLKGLDGLLFPTGLPPPSKARRTYCVTMDALPTVSVPLNPTPFLLVARIGPITLYPHAPLENGSSGTVLSPQAGSREGGWGRGSRLTGCALVVSSSSCFAFLARGLHNSGRPDLHQDRRS